MSQYLIIFLIVAVFRGVVWVVQKVQQNAKAREALMAEGANAQMGGAPDAVAAMPESSSRAASGVAAVPAQDPASVGARPSVSSTSRAALVAQRGKVPGTVRGAAVSAQRGTGGRAANRAPVAKAARVVAAAGSGRSNSAPPRADHGTRPAGPQRQPARATSPASRTDQREARVGQSSRDVRNLLRDPSSLRQALLAREILGPPRSLEA